MILVFVQLTTTQLEYIIIEGMALMRGSRMFCKQKAKTLSKQNSEKPNDYLITT